MDLFDLQEYSESIDKNWGSFLVDSSKFKIAQTGFLGEKNQLDHFGENKD